MGKFDGILICTDLDGTLLKNDKTISVENSEAIEYFKREGGYFTFITGRMPYYAIESYNTVKPNVPFGCINGGGVYDGARRKYVWSCEISMQVLELVHYIDDNFPGIGIQICTLDNTYFLRENHAMELFRAATKLPNLTCDYCDVKPPVAKIIFGSESDSELREVEKMLRAHPVANNFEFIRSDKMLFEILPKGVHKGLALQKLVEYLGVDSGKTVAVGDYNNDIGMFKVASVGIAVSNACPEALEAADIITVSNEEHAIAKVIYSLEDGTYAFAKNECK